MCGQSLGKFTPLKISLGNSTLAQILEGTLVATETVNETFKYPNVFFNFGKTKILIGFKFRDISANIYITNQPFIVNKFGMSYFAQKLLWNDVLHLHDLKLDP